MAQAEVKQCFWDLASVDVQTRKQAAETLALALERDARVTTKADAHAAQLQMEPHGTQVEGERETDSEAGLAEPSFGGKASGEMGKKGGSLTQYAWDRLARGLASPRAAARQGFALAICIALQDPRCPMSNAEVFDLLREHLPANGKGREARDALLGRLFGIGALARAKRLGNEKDALAACELVVDAAERKQFLQEAAAAVIVEIVDACNGNLFEKGTPLYRWMVEAKPEDARAPHALYALLACWEDVPADVAREAELLPLMDEDSTKTKLSKMKGRKAKGAMPASGKDIDRLRASSFLAGKHLEKLAPVFAGTSCAHPRTHRTWLHLLGMLIHGTCTPFDVASKPEPRFMPCLHDFWKLAVEGPLLDGGSHDRKFLAMELFELVLPWVVADQIPILFSEPFLLNLRTHVKNKNSLLHKKAELTEATIENYMARHAADSTRVAIDRALRDLGKRPQAGLAENGQDEKPNALRAEESNASGRENLDALLHRFATFRSEGQGEEEGVGGESHVDILEKICKLFKTSESDDSLRCEALRFLAAVAFLEVAEPTNKTSKLKELDCLSRLSEKLNVSTRNTAIARLSKYSALYSEQKKGLVVNGKKADGLLVVLDFIQASFKRGATLVSGDVEEINPAVKLLRKASKRVQALSDSGETTYTKANFNVVQHFLMVHELQLYVDPYSGYMEVVDDVCMALENAWAVGSPDWTKLLNAKEEQEASVEPHWMDVLVDAITIFLTKSSSVPCEAASALFRVFADHLSRRGLEDLLDHISSQPATVENEDDSESEEEEEEESSQEDSDSEEESQAETDDGSDMEVEGDSNPVKDEDDDVVFSDEQMFKLDKYLVDAFHSARERISEGKQAAEQVVSFKVRVIGLLEVYVKKCPSSPLLPFAVHPLLKSMQLPLGSKELKEGLSGLLKGRICKSKAEASGSKLSIDVVHGLLKAALEKASQSSSKEVSSAAEQCSRYLLRASFGAIKATGATTLDLGTREIATHALMDYFLKKKCHLSHFFLAGTVTAFPEVGLSLLPPLMSAQEGLNEFLLLESLQLVLVVSRSCTPKFAMELHNAVHLNREQFVGLLLHALTREWTKQKKTNEAIKLVHQLMQQMLKLQKQSSQRLSLSASSCQKITEAATALENNPSALTQHKNMLKSIKVSVEACQATSREPAQTRKSKQRDRDADLTGADSQGMSTPRPKSARKARNRGDP